MGNTNSTAQGGQTNGCPVGMLQRTFMIHPHPDEVAKRKMDIQLIVADKELSANHNIGSPPSIHGTSDNAMISECPVKHTDNVAMKNESSEEGCPVKHDRSMNYKKEDTSSASALNTMYNVYSQPIDPKNNMPAVANQLPNASQRTKLSTDRQKSTIPKGGTEKKESWTYPSPQMFYNSLVRKGKLDPEVCSEEDVESVVHLHNNMNEKTWYKVMEWEAQAESTDSKLSKFIGRPMDLSPKAWIKNKIFGHPLPFDRHDWTIVREDGTEVRYVIDYYHDDHSASDDKESAFPNMHNHNAVKSILVDVRPAVDSAESIFARSFRMPYNRFTGKSDYEPMPMLPSESLKLQVSEADKVWENIQANAAANRSKPHSSEDTTQGARNTNESKISEKEATDLAKKYYQIIEDCKETQYKMSTCESEEECSRASLDLTLCMAKIACPLQHSAVIESIHSPVDDESEKVYNARVDASLENADLCISQVNDLVLKAKKQHGDIFERHKNN